MTDPYRAPPAGWKPEPRDGSSFLKREVPPSGRVPLPVSFFAGRPLTDAELARVTDAMRTPDSTTTPTKEPA